MSSEYKRVRDYELMVIFHPELSEEDLAAEIAKVEGHITAGEATITLVNRESPWGRRRLAYAIRHDSRDIRDGFYVLYYFTSDSTRLADMEREIKLQDRIMRYLLTQQSAPIMEPEAPEAEGADGEAAPAADAPSKETPAPAAEVPSTEVDTPAATEEVPAAEAETPAVDAEEAPAAVGEEASAAVEAAPETKGAPVADEAAAPDADATAAAARGEADDTK